MDTLQKHRDAVKDGLKELEKLTAKKMSIESEIFKLVQLIALNIAILPASERPSLGMKLEAAQAPSGLSDAIKRVLSFTEYKSAAEVRDALIDSGYDLSTQVNPLASIHTTLRRLDKAIIESKEENGRMVYRRKRTLPPLR